MSVVSEPQVRDMIAAQQARSREQIARYEQVRAVLERLRVTGESTDGTVSVQMGAGGAIHDIKITDVGMSKTAETLAATILEAIRAGLAKVAERTAAEVEPLTGRRVDVAAVAAGRLPSVAPAGRVDSRFAVEDEED